MRFFNPVNIVKHLWQYKELIKQLTLREVSQRYKGSYLGFTWAFLQPLFMLCVYTFVFSVIFESKWGLESGGGKLGFAIALFCGILTFNLLGDTANAAPALILSHANFVKKVIFPLEILPVVKILDTFLHSCFGLGILFLGMLIAGYPFKWTIFLLPLVWMPMILFSLGCCFFLSSFGVFVRDIGTTISVLVTVLFFMSPIFYPLEAVPTSFRFICQLNPIAIYVENARSVLLWGKIPDLNWFFISFVLSIVVFILGFIFFMRSKRAFADVM